MYLCMFAYCFFWRTFPFVAVTIGNARMPEGGVLRACQGVTRSDPCVPVLTFPPFMVDDLQVHGRDCTPAGSLNAA